MGDVVNGYILSHSFGSNAERIYLRNKSVIEELPDYGAWLIKSMFSQVPLNERFHIDTFQIIHFAGVYDEMYGLERSWIEDFEKLLSTLSWWESVVFHSSSGVRVEFESKDHEVDSEAIPTSEWTKIFYGSYHDIAEIEF